MSSLISLEVIVSKPEVGSSYKIISGSRKGEQNSQVIFSDIIKNLNPDVILAEIPPDRFLIANEQFQKTGTSGNGRDLKHPIMPWAGGCSLLKMIP